MVEMDIMADFLISNYKIPIFLILYRFMTLLYFRENWSGDPRKRMKLKKKTFNSKASHRLSEMFRDA